MSENERYVVICVDGEAADLGDLSTPSLRYENLTWEDSVTLAKLSFTQGFEVILWKVDDGLHKEGGSVTCGETQGSE
jgi:hypothetical protein